MDHTDFSNQIGAMSGHVAKLRGDWSESTADPQVVGDEIFESFNVPLEEVRVAEEEPQSQNRQILAMQDALEAERQRYFDLFHQAPDGYLVTDLYGTIRDANTAAARLLGVPH